MTCNKQLCRPIGWIKVLLMNILLILPNYLTTFVANNDFQNKTTTRTIKKKKRTTMHRSQPN